MKQALLSFIGGIKEWKTSRKVFTAIIALIAIIAVKVLSAQFLYTEIGYKPAHTDEEFRYALSVSPFTATGFEKGYTYEYEDRQITNIEELEQLYIDKGATEMYVRIATKRHVTDKDETDGVVDTNANVHTFDQAMELCKLAAKLNIPINYVNTHSSDIFYKENDNFQELYEKYGCACVEMESFALFHNANVLGKKAACLLTISDNLVTHAETTSEERQSSFNQMIELALESVEE